MNFQPQNQSENELLAHLKANTTTNNVRLSLHPNNPQNEVKAEPVNTCFVNIDGSNKTFEYISSTFYDEVYNEYDLKSEKNLKQWRKRFEKR